MYARPLIACLATALIACLARADELKPVKVGSRTIAGTVKLRKGVEPPYADQSKIRFPGGRS